MIILIENNTYTYFIHALDLQKIFVKKTQSSNNTITDIIYEQWRRRRLIRFIVFDKAFP